MATQLAVTPQITIHNGQAVTTSQDVANYFCKQHKDVLKKIRTLECSPEFTTANFCAIVVTTSAGFDERKTEAYQITRDGFTFLAMAFTGKKAARFKEEDKEHAERTLLSINNQKQKY